MNAPTARSLMNDFLIRVSPESSLLDVLRVFVDENIHGAPVVDEDGGVLGVITTSDLLRAQEDEHDTVLATADYLREFLEFSSPDWAGNVGDFQDRLSGRQAGDVMTKGLISVSADAPAVEVARCLRRNKIHRVWVEEDGRLCGVISALDLMPVIEASASST